MIMCRDPGQNRLDNSYLTFAVLCIWHCTFYPPWWTGGWTKSNRLVRVELLGYILANSIALTSNIFTELADTMKYVGVSLIVAMQKGFRWPTCVSQNYDKIAYFTMQSRKLPGVLQLAQSIKVHQMLIWCWKTVCDVGPTTKSALGKY